MDGKKYYIILVCVYKTVIDFANISDWSHLKKDNVPAPVNQVQFQLFISNQFMFQNFLIQCKRKQLES